MMMMTILIMMMMMMTTTKVTMMTIMMVTVMVMVMVSQSLYEEKLARLGGWSSQLFVSLVNGLLRFVRKCRNSWLPSVGRVGDPNTGIMFSSETWICRINLDFSGNCPPTHPLS